ncbi:MAG: Rrf2 family transcriptional regulator [Bacteriovoracaceae bacterium]
MIKISRKMEYSLMALQYIRKNGESKWVSTREICSTLGVPFDTMSKVMQLMHLHGIIESGRGVKGGYQLSKNLSTISYATLNEIIEQEENQESSGCFKQCDLSEQCIIKDPILKLNSKLLSFFQNITIGELLTWEASEYLGQEGTYHDIQ